MDGNVDPFNPAAPGRTLATPGRTQPHLSDTRPQQDRPMPEHEADQHEADQYKADQHEADQYDPHQLCELAIAARRHAYSPYSDFAVGAALLCEDGTVASGCNVENGVLGLSLCAERVAICQAIARGQQSFRAIAVAASPLASPCGPCRQFLAEFCEDLEIIAVDAESYANQASPAGELTRSGEIQQWRLSELLPRRFRYAGKERSSDK